MLTPTAPTCAVALTLAAALFLVPAPGHAAPADLTIRGTTARFEPWSNATLLSIEPGGAGEYLEENTYTSSAPTVPAVQNSFVLSAGNLDTIWNAVVANNFFGLAPELGDETVLGSDYLHLTILANGAEHTVVLSHGTSTAIENIVNAINSVTPAGNDLGLPSSPAKPGVRLDPKRTPPAGNSGVSPDRGLGHDHPKARAWREDVLSRLGTGFPELNTANPPKFPGGSMSWCCPLQDWVDSAKVTVTATGSINGNAAKMTVTNTMPVMKDSLKLTVNLEFWGDEADSQTVANVVAGVTAIFANKTTTAGKPIKLCINTKLDTAAAAAPGTPGYHQIELDNTDDAGRPIISHVHAITPINKGTGGGTWEGDPSADIDAAGLANAYAHEVGHLLGLPDRYKDYRRLANGNWRLRGGGPEITPAALGTMMFNQFGTSTEADWQAHVGRAGFNRFTPLCPGVAATDIMATIGAGAALSQADVDSLAACPGIKVSVRKGDVLVNEDPGRQDMVITQDCEFFTPKDSTFCWDTIQATCIDPSLSPPTAGQKFDVAANVCEWEGFESALNLKKLLDVIQAKGLWGTPEALDAIWWIVAGVPFSGTNPLLACADLSSAARKDDWPGPLSNFGTNDSTEVVYPIELIHIRIDPWWWSLYPANPWPYDSYWVWPYSWPFEPFISGDTYLWTLNAFPTGSLGYLDPLTGPSTTIFPDLCGSYRLFVDAQATVTTPHVAGNIAATAPATFHVTENLRTMEDPTDLSGLQMNPPGSWNFSTSVSYSGGTSLNAGIHPAPVRVLRATVDLTTAADSLVKFNVRSYLVPGHNFAFLVDDNPVYFLNGVSPDWEQVRIPLATGQVYELAWVADMNAPTTQPSEVFLDDLMLPGQLVQSGVPGGGPTPALLTVAQNFPNPVLSRTSIRFHLVRGDRVTLDVYNASGALVRRLLDEQRPAGAQSVDFEAGHLPAGLYFYRMVTGSGLSVSRKMVVMK